MKGNLSKMGKLVLALCELAIGVMLLIDPNGFTSGIITAVGVALLVAGVCHILGYFRKTPGMAVLERGLARGLLEAAAGLFCVLKSSWFFGLFPVLTVLYGIGILVSGVVKLQWAVDMLRLKARRWVWAAVSAAVTLVCAVVILCDPFATAAVLWMFIAVTLIVEAVVDALAAIFARERETELE